MSWNVDDLTYLHSIPRRQIVLHILHVHICTSHPNTQVLYSYLDKVVDIKIPNPASMPLAALARIYWIGVDDFRTVRAGEGLV